MLLVCALMHALLPTMNDHSKFDLQPRARLISLATPHSSLESEEPNTSKQVLLKEFTMHVDSLRAILQKSSLSEAERAELRGVIRHDLLGSFNADAFEEERLAADSAAMDAMKEEAELAFAGLRTPWKWAIRQRIWDLLEEKNIAQPPRPVHHRIPNFQDASVAAQRLAKLPAFAAAQCVKVNPDTPQRPVRRAVLEQRKILLTPQPRLRSGFFSRLDPDSISPDKLKECTTSKGVAAFGEPVDLNAEFNVDLVVVGSTAVCPRTGARVGKGEGFAELEWGILTEMRNLDPNRTLVVTTVHDLQVVNDIPADQLTQHDVPVDIIVTPTRTINVAERAPKPSGVFWELLSPQKLAQIRVLQQLKQQVEAERGTTLPVGPDERLPPTAERRETFSRGAGRGRSGRGRTRRGGGSNRRGKVNLPI